jgi:hypothetical protein
VHAGRVEVARRELLLAQIDAIRDGERSGALSTKVARLALAQLDEALAGSEFVKEHIEEVGKTALGMLPLDFVGADKELSIDLEPVSTADIVGIDLDALEEE